MDDFRKQRSQQIQINDGVQEPVNIDNRVGKESLAEINKAKTIGDWLRSVE